MSKNAPSDSDTNRKPDNPQETLNEENYYFSGFMAAEMSCCVIKAANNHPVGHYYFKVDITISNADKSLLENIKTVIMREGATITPIKGGFNLSARGKKRVRCVLDFLDRYPIIAGDLAKDRIVLMREALAYLEAHRGSSRHEAKIIVMDDIRKRLQAIKETGVASRSYHQERTNKKAIGFFLAGVLDGDGSFGFKRNNNYLEPFLAIAMKDEKIIKLLKEFIRHGNIRQRKDGMYHYELNKRKVLQDVCKLFLTQYPLRHAGQCERMQHLQRILNDYTRNRIGLP